MLETEKACRKYQNGQVRGPHNLSVRFFDSMNFLKNKKICMEKVVGEQDLALQQHFPYKSSKFSKNLNCGINLLLNSRGLKLGHFDIFQCAISIISILQVTFHNKQKFQEKVGHVIPAAKGLLA